MHAEPNLDRRVPVRPLLVILLALAPACASPAQAPNAAAPAASAGPQASAPAAAPANNERALADAHDKLAIARMQLELSDARAASASLRKQQELDAARAELALFQESDAPSQLARSKLDLARRQDALSEQKEELEQLEMLYEKQDLADKTREIVLQRGRRRVERAQDELAISERDAAALESQKLPRQRAKLEFEASAKERELAEQKSEAAIGQLEKRMAVRNAEADLKAAEAKAGVPAKP